jgi:hypothetical protein
MQEDATTTIVIAPDGSIRMLHDDRLQPLVRLLGNPSIRRASHVEPTEEGQWTADMAPVQGPVLGPFPTRGEALAAEKAWLLTAGIPEPGIPEPGIPEPPPGKDRTPHE